jgi:hypothetical protein
LFQLHRQHSIAALEWNRVLACRGGCNFGHAVQAVFLLQIFPIAARRGEHVVVKPNYQYEKRQKELEKKKKKEEKLKRKQERPVSPVNDEHELPQPVEHDAQTEPP